MNELASLYGDPGPAQVNLSDLVCSAQRVRDELTHASVDGTVWYSPAEIFGMVVFALAEYALHGRLPDPVPVRRLLGPVDLDEPDDVDQTIGVPADDVLGALRTLNRTMDFRPTVPATVQFAGARLPPSCALRGLADLLVRLANWADKPDTIVFDRRTVLPRIASEGYFQEQTFTHGDLYPDGFTGERVCAYCRLQSWSYKPAWPRSCATGTRSCAT